MTIDLRAPSMRLWMDTEFLEDGKTVDLLSIGIVRADEKEYYAVSSDCDVKKANDWVKKNVLPKIDWKLARPRKQIRHEINRFVEDYHPEFWAYYADYDWVVFCQLFGKMVDLPSNWPMFCRDVKQLADHLGNPRLPAKPKDEHHALEDARWTMRAWKFLVERQRHLYDHATDLIREIENHRHSDRLTTLARELSLALPPRP